jgi:hypothetical protein
MLVSFLAVIIDGPTLHFYYDSPLHPTVYKVVKGSLTGVQKAFDDLTHNTIAKNDQFTVVLDDSSPIYNEQRQWYEIPAIFCYGGNIEECMKKKRSFGKPYLVRPLSVETPVPFMVPFSKLSNITLPDGKTVFEAGTVHPHFKTFNVNGAKYDSSSGILVSFSAESSQQAGPISGIIFARQTGRVLKPQPLIQCHFVEWSTDGCVPGLNHMMFGYDFKSMETAGRPWLKPVEFPGKRDEKYLQTLHILGIGQKNYLVFKEMTLKKVSPIANPFSYLFESVEEQLKTSLKSVGVTYAKGTFLGSGKYKSLSKYYSKQSYTAAMSGVEYRFFRATMASSYLTDETNWDDDFKKKWKSIFDQSKRGNAMAFFREYGTHYIVEAVLGGRQETVFIVNYCEISKEKARKIAFEAELKKPYQFNANGVSVETNYKEMLKHLSKNIFISGPQTTCIGGDSMDLDICYDITLWRPTVLTSPFPVRMTLRPFYSFVKDYEDRLWMEKMFQEYLKTDLDEVKINHDIQLKVKCTAQTPTNAVLTSPGFVVLWSLLFLPQLS